MGHLASLTDAPRKGRMTRAQLAGMVAIPLVAILFQVYVPRFLTFLAYLELPLLVTVYFALMRNSPVAGLLFGAAVGLAQDSLSQNPLGMFGIVKTLVGYFAGSFSQRFAADNPLFRVGLSLFFYVFHQFFYWVLSRALLGEAVNFDFQQVLIFGALNAIIAAPLYRILDKLRVAGP